MYLYILIKSWIFNRQKNNHTRIYFGNGYSYEVPCDYRTVKSQMKRCDQFIHTVMQNKKDLVIDFREIYH